jgi:POT family proton-dependent oligopeptide transporter
MVGSTFRRLKVAVLLGNSAVKNEGVIYEIQHQGWGLMASQMYFFAGFAFVAAGAFGWYAKRYPVADSSRAERLYASMRCPTRFLRAF